MSHVIIYTTSGFLFYLFLHKHTYFCDPISPQLSVQSIIKSYHLKVLMCTHFSSSPVSPCSFKVMPSVPETCSFQVIACLPANTIIQSMLTPKWSFQHEHLYHFPTQHISMSDPGSKAFSGPHVSAHPHSLTPSLSLWANLLDFFFTSATLPQPPAPIFSTKMLLPSVYKSFLFSSSLFLPHNFNSSPHTSLQVTSPGSHFLRKYTYSLKICSCYIAPCGPTLVM